HETVVQTLTARFLLGENDLERRIRTKMPGEVPPAVSLEFIRRPVQSHNQARRYLSAGNRFQGGDRSECEREPPFLWVEDRFYNDNSSRSADQSPKRGRILCGS